MYLAGFVGRLEGGCISELGSPGRRRIGINEVLVRMGRISEIGRNLLDWKTMAFIHNRQIFVKHLSYFVFHRQDLVTSGSFPQA